MRQLQSCRLPGSRLTFGIKKLLLRRILLVNRAELEAKRLGIVLWTWYAYHCRGCIAFDRLGGDNGILVQLLLEQGADSRDDADAHGEMEGRGRKGLRSNRTKDYVYREKNGDLP